MSFEIYWKLDTQEPLAFRLGSFRGVVETSLFYNIATKAIVVSEEGTRIINKK